MNIQEFQKIIHRRLLVIYPELREKMKSFNRKRTILMIRRSNRQLVAFNETKIALTKKFPHLNIIEFRDDPSPTVAETMRLFYEADMVLGPHGAGFANIVACRTGTVILEFLSAEPDTNFCYLTLARQVQGKYYCSIADQRSSYYGTIYGSLEDTIKIIQLNFQSQSK